MQQANNQKDLFNETEIRILKECPECGSRRMTSFNPEAEMWCLECGHKFLNQNGIWILFLKIKSKGGEKNDDRRIY